MSELVMERVFAADVETVYAFLTNTEHLLKWWGPEGVHIGDHDLDLSRPGRWSSTMVNAEGKTFKVTGEVTHIDPPRSVAFTWGWHDDEDQRGHESQVRFEVEANAGGGARFVMTHSGLADDESARMHNEGWTSSLLKLERLDN